MDVLKKRNTNCVLGKENKKKSVCGVTTQEYMVVNSNKHKSHLVLLAG